MAQRIQLDHVNNPLYEAYACLLANGVDGTGEALRILVNMKRTPNLKQVFKWDPVQRNG